MFKLVIFFLFWLVFCIHDCPLAGNTQRLFQIFFLLFNLMTSAVTAYGVGVFKLTPHDLSMFLALRKFDSKEGKLELDYHN